MCFVRSGNIYVWSIADDAGDDDVAAKISCRPGALYNRGSCYEFFNSAITWDSAEEACRNLRPGSQLLSISSSREERIVSAYIRRYSSSYYVWIGLYAVPHANTLKWEWSDRSQYIPGTPLWDGRSPSTSISSSECVALYTYPSSSARWYQQNCDASYPYVCKYKA
ncbi:regenerating islet-derived protein 3-gamma-like [Heteronotia binoei]|uniref:regenerating islet-derived protein 3-gamma-like n=1 Tax=Heteronotia binoei TaxID=13085 RepID=UPI00292E5082|nr:regenerating islet-derived protein 3-gamma-like [Heteronotia binoei]